MWRDDAGLTFHVVSQTDLEAVAKAFLEKAGDHKVWLLIGEMGSGKTTFIKQLCRTLGVSQTMSSPTFSIVNEYETDHHQTVFHFDFYRIKNEAEAYDIGTEDYFYSGNYCFVEWPEKIPGLIPEQYVKVVITPENETNRTLAISVHDGKKENRI